MTLDSDTDNSSVFADILAAVARAGSVSCSLWIQQSPLKGRAAIRTAAGLCRSTLSAHALFPMLMLLAPTPEVITTTMLPSVLSPGYLPDMSLASCSGGRVAHKAKTALNVMGDADCGGGVSEVLLGHSAHG